LKSLEEKICGKEVKSFRCCFEMKGEDRCKEFLELVRHCYMNKGRRVRKDRESLY